MYENPPSSLDMSLWEWFASKENKHKCNYVTFLFNDPFILSEPKSVEHPVHWKFRTYLRPSPPGFVGTITNGRIFGSKGLVITPDNKWLWSFYPNEDLSAFPVSPVQYIDATIADLRHVWAGGNYYHWMFDVLPRIDLLRKSKIPIEKYVISPNGLSFKLETLQMIGISPKQVIISDRTTNLQAKTLVVSSYARELIGGEVSRLKWACDFLRNQLLPKKNAIDWKGYKRIFISRKGAKRRRIKNEEKVFERLAELGFKEVHLETLAVSEQIQLFSNANIIVAPHGAGLTNLAFCSPSAKVIEFFSPLCIRPIYRIISSHVHLDYFYLLGKGRRFPDHVDPEKGNAHIKINIEKLNKLLDLAGISREKE